MEFDGPTGEPDVPEMTAGTGRDAGAAGTRGGADDRRGGAAGGRRRRRSDLGAPRSRRMVGSYAAVGPGVDGCRLLGDLRHVVLLLPARSALQPDHDGGRRHRGAPLPGHVHDQGAAAALPADRLGAGLVCGHADAHLLLPVPVPADRHLERRAAVRAGVQADHGPRRVPAAGDRVCIRTAPADPVAVPAIGRGRGGGIPADGELLHLRGQHPQHSGGRVRLSPSVSRWCGCSWARCIVAWRGTATTGSSP